MADPIELLIQGRAHDLGPGFAVRRVLPSMKRRTVGPFIFLDHFGPMTVPPGGDGMEVRPHPHIGLATVTYLFGSGIVHSERTEAEMKKSGFTMHGVQTWVALPKAHEETAPAFEHVAAADLPAWSEGGASLRLIVGTYAGRTAPTTHFSPIFYVAVEMPAAARIAVTPEHAERGVYVSEGRVTIGDRQLAVGDLAVLAPGSAVDVVAGPEGAKLMLLGGAPLEAPRHIWWNFVSSSKERIEQAKADWKEGRFAKVPGEVEFIPLPDK